MSDYSSKCKFDRVRDKIVPHIISECSKVTQKEYKTDWTGKVIQQELYMILKFNHSAKYARTRILSWEWDVKNS